MSIIDARPFNFNRKNVASPYAALSCAPSHKLVRTFHKRTARHMPRLFFIFNLATAF